METSRGWRIAKEKASHKIDAVVALAIACHAAVSLREPEEPPIVRPYAYSKTSGVISDPAMPIDPVPQQRLSSRRQRSAQCHPQAGSRDHPVEQNC